MAKKSKQKRAVKTTALVIYDKNKNNINKTNKNRNKNKNKNKLNGNSGLANYKAALADPFSLLAQGARIPDMYSVPTVTRHITRTFTIRTSAVGDCDVVILPSAYHHAISTRSSLVNGATWTTLDGASLPNALQYTTPSVLASQITNYRIVGYGVKLLGVSSIVNTAGRVLCATVPVSSYINDKTAKVGQQAPNSNNPNATVAATMLAYGIPLSGSTVDVQALASLPNSVETSLASITATPLTITPKISSPEAFNFRQTDDSAIGFSITDQTSTAYVSSGDASYLRIGGHEAVVISGAGMPNSVSVMELEVVYHLEGTPYQSTTAFGIVGQDSELNFVNPIGFMSVVQAVARLPAFRQKLEDVGNSIVPGLGNLANRLY